MARKQVVRLTALAVATGTLVAAGIGSASAAPADKTVLGATGEGAAVKLTINVPEALSSVLGKQIVQTISLTKGSASTVDSVSAITTAVLGDGNTPVVSGLLNKLTKAELGGKLQDKMPGIIDIDQPGLKVRVLPLESVVANPVGMAKGTITESKSAVAEVQIGGLGALPAALDGVTAPLTDVLEGALGTGGAVGTVTETVNETIDTLTKATKDTDAPLPPATQEAVEDTIEELNGTLNGLQDLLGDLNTAGDILSLDSITSTQKITREGAAVTSSVENTIKAISVLDGLVKVDALQSLASATAGGTPGTAKTSVKPAVLKVDVANGALTAVLDENGLNVGGTVGSALPAELQDAVNGALDSVNGLLNELAGIDVQLGKGETFEAPDGTAAKAAVAATVLTVSPPVLHDLGLLPADKKFLTLELVPAAVEVQAAAKPQVITPQAPPASLPRTGAALPITGAVATFMVGAGLVARRRRLAAL